jgi:hypothetical protein
VSARGEIAKALAGAQSYYPELMERLEAEIAHKLAEKIRAAAPSELPDTCYREAADLIDPEKPDA